MTKFNLMAAALFAVSAAFSAEIVSIKRQPGDRLDISMANEVTHSALAAQSWLMRRQNANGSWGDGTNCLYDTMVTLYALKAFRQPEAEKAIGRGEGYLATLKLDYGFPAFPFGVNLKVDLEQTAKAWPLLGSTCAKDWWALACSLNRARIGKAGAIAGKSIDWRKDIAKHLITSQKMTDKGDGYWASGKPDVSDIAETAFMLMVFFEL